MALGHILSRSISHSERSEAMTTRPPAALTKNLNRLLSAAVVSPRFRQLLLSDPATAVAMGCNGEKFQLTPAEFDAVTSVAHSPVGVDSIREFAAQLVRCYHTVINEPAVYAPEQQAELRLAEVAAH